MSTSDLPLQPAGSSSGGGGGGSGGSGSGGRAGRSEALVAPPAPAWLTARLRQATMLSGSAAVVVSTVTIGVNSGLDAGAADTKGAVNVFAGMLMFVGMGLLNVALMGTGNVRAQDQ